MVILRNKMGNDRCLTLLLPVIYLNVRLNCNFKTLMQCDKYILYMDFKGKGCNTLLLLLVARKMSRV